MDELLPCPFCGHVAAINKDRNSKTDYKFYAFCTNCLVKTDNYLFPKNAIDMWNTREGK